MPTDYKKLLEGCPLINEIDARGGTGSAHDRTWTELLQNAQEMVFAADPTLGEEHARAVRRLDALAAPSLASPEGQEVLRIERRGQQILRELCNRPIS